MSLREFFDRYGVPLGAIVALAVVIAVLPGNAKPGVGVQTAGGAYAAGNAGTNANGASPVVTDANGVPVPGAAPGTPGATASGAGGPGGAAAPGAPAAPAGSQVAFGQGPHCNPQGRQI